MSNFLGWRHSNASRFTRYPTFRNQLVKWMKLDVGLNSLADVLAPTRCLLDVHSLALTLL